MGRIAPRLGHAAGVTGKGDARQNADDGDHDHELDQGEAAVAARVRVGVHDGLLFHDFAPGDAAGHFGEFLGADVSGVVAGLARIHS